MTISYILCFSAAFLMLFFVAEWLHKSRRIKAETTRKIVHIGSGFLTLSFPLFFSDLWPVLLLTGSFFIILLASVAGSFLKSVNGVRRKSYGSFLYPIAVAVSFWWAWQQGAWVYFYLPIACMVISDPLAAIAGNATQLNKKSMRGSMAFFLSAFCIAFLLLYGIENQQFLSTILMSVALGILLTVVEYFSTKGWDNLTIPLFGIGLLAIFQNSGLWM